MAQTLAAGNARLTFRPSCGGTVDELLLEPPAGGEAVAILASQGASEGESEECEPGLYRGRLLAPFSDRIPGGRYQFGGKHFQLPVNDKEAGDAIHGYMYSRAMRVRTLRGDVAVLGHRSRGDYPGYPFELDITARYELAPGSLRLTLTARNAGIDPLPVTLGWHPYFTFPGVNRVDPLLLQLPAERYVAVDDTLLPTGELPEVHGTSWDFRSLRPVGSGGLDLGFPLEGKRILLREPQESGRTLAIDLEGAFRYCQLFVPPGRESIAIEPLTGATNAFNRPELGLTVLTSGEEIHGTCRLRLS